MCVDHEPNAPNLSRRAALATGAGLSLAALAGVAQPAAVAAAKYKVVEVGWRFCEKCRGLFFGPDGDPAGVCPAGGKHQPALPLNDVNYLYNGGVSGARFTAPFVRCSKCAGLVLPGGTGNNICPKGGGHNPNGTQQYQVYGGPEGTPLIDDAWDYCINCYGIFNWAGSGTRAGVCPSPGPSPGNGHWRATRRYGFVVLS